MSTYTLFNLLPNSLGEITKANAICRVLAGRENELAAPMAAVVAAIENSRSVRKNGGDAEAAKKNLADAKNALLAEAEKLSGLSGEVYTLTVLGGTRHKRASKAFATREEALRWADATVDSWRAAGIKSGVELSGPCGHEEMYGKNVSGFADANKNGG